MTASLGTLRTAVVVGNPKPASRTLAAAARLARELTGAEPDPVVDLARLGPKLLGWGDPEVDSVIERVRGSDLVVVASPTFKATYTGLLKLFLDLLPYEGLRGVTAVPLMLGAGPGHALAPETGLRPVLVELGASVPTRAAYLEEREYDDPTAFDRWLVAARPTLAHLLTPTLTHTAEGATR